MPMMTQKSQYFIIKLILNLFTVTGYEKDFSQWSRNLQWVDKRKALWNSLVHHRKNKKLAKENPSDLTPLA